MKKKEIIARIEENDNYYRNIAKDCLKQFKKFDDFQMTILSEVISELIEKHYSIQECFSKVSKNYNVNCKRIVFFALMPTVKQKFLYLKHSDEVICGCISEVKNMVVDIAFKVA